MQNLPLDIDLMVSMLRDVKDTPELRFQQVQWLPRGEMYRLPVERDSNGQAFHRVLIHPSDVETVRATLLPLLHPIYGRLPKGLE